MSNSDVTAVAAAVAVVVAVVVANGAPPDPALCAPLLRAADLVVAADGGARALLQHGLPLTAIVGDMDSLPADLLEGWVARGGAVRRYPRDKDETDLELAVAEAQRRGATRIAVLGALGGRVDHQMANLLLLAGPALAGVEAALLDDGTRVVAVTGAADADVENAAGRVELAGRPGDMLSLLPVTGRVEGVVTRGLRYPLAGDTLVLGSPRGVSNVFQARRATVEVRSGTLLALHTWTERRPLEL
jgi:thiamine pyrophosphokinase